MDHPLRLGGGGARPAWEHRQTGKGLNGGDPQAALGMKPKPEYQENQRIKGESAPVKL